MKQHGVYGEYFYGNKISNYGIENGRVDYSTLAKSFDCVLANDFMEKTSNIGYWEIYNGFYDNSEEIENLEYRLEEIEEELKEAEEGTPAHDVLEQEKERIEFDMGELIEEQDCIYECYQYYIIGSNGAEILKDYTNEYVWYNEELDLYVWGVTHWGTSWDYVLTCIPCNMGIE